MKVLRVRLQFKLLLKLLPFILILALSLWAIFQLKVKNNLARGEMMQVGINYLTNNGLLIADELHHFEQIIGFVQGNFNLHPFLAMGPGYHFIIAMMIRLIGLIGIIGNTPFVARLIHLSFSLLFIPAVYLTARELDKKTAYLRTLQISFFPLFFPFYFLIYSDMLSLTLVILAFYLTIQKKYYLAGLMLLISLTIRQSNIIWLPFFIFLMVTAESGRWVGHLSILGYLRKGAVFLLSLISFSVFVYYNRGVSLGEKNMHPYTLREFSNFYFFLFTFLMTLLPLHLANISKVIQMLNRKKVIIAGLSLGFIFYLFTFKVSHPYNHIPNFIRNDLLIFFVSDFWLYTVFYIFICLALLSLISVKLIANRYYAFYIIGLMSILSSSLIEVRYYFVPLAFFLLLRRSESKRVEYAVLTLFIIGALTLAMITVEGKYFI